MHTDEAASIAVACLFGVACVAAVASKVKTGFKVYLLLGLSSLLRSIGFACRAAQWSDLTNTDIAAASLVFRQAGWGISIAVLCLLLGCWFKNADERGRPPRSWPVWSVGVRLLIAPVIVFGPIIGIVIAALVFGVATPDSISTGNTLRKASSWTFLVVVAILQVLAHIAATYVLRWQHAEANPQPQRAPSASSAHRSSSLQRLNSTLRLAARHAHSWVHMMQALCVLLQLSTIFRVVGIYEPQYNTNANLFYPLEVLPELLYVLLLLLPTVMVRVGMAGNYEAFAAAVKAGQPYVAGAIPADIEAAAHSSGEQNGHVLAGMHAESH